MKRKSIVQYWLSTSTCTVTTPTFTIDLATIPNSVDINHCDNALFRINSGYQDYNANGLTSREEILGGEFEQYEFFTGTAIPGFGGDGNGSYIQSVDTSLLPEGRNYLSVIAFRQRP